MQNFPHFFRKIKKRFGKATPLIFGVAVTLLLSLLAWLLCTPTGNLWMMAAIMAGLYVFEKWRLAKEKAVQHHRDMLENRKKLMADFMYFFIYTYSRNLPVAVHHYLTQTEIFRCATAAEIAEGVIVVKFELPRDTFYESYDERSIAIFRSLLSRCAVDYCEQNNMPGKAFDSGFDYIDCDNLVITRFSVDVSLVLLDNWTAVSRKQRIIISKRQQQHCSLPTLDDDLKNDKSEDEIFL